MSDHTAELVDKLAAKLGTTAQYLWDCLLRQAPISSALYFATMVGMGIAVYCLVRVIKVRFPKDIDSYGDPKAATFILMVIAGILGFILLILIICGLEMGVAGFFNPGYWALKQILTKNE